MKGEKLSHLIDNLEVCRRLGVKPNTWRKRVTKGMAPLPFTSMGDRTYYRVADVQHFLRVGLWPATMKFRGRKVEPEPGRPVLDPAD